MNDETEQTAIHCPKCKSTSWRCYDEVSRMCVDSQDNYIGDRVIGAMVCKDCGYDWLDYAVDPAIDEPDCECEEY